MGLLERLAAAVHEATRPKSAASAFGSLFAAGLDQVFGSTDLMQPFMQHPTVYGAVSAIADNLAGLEREMFPVSDTKRERPVKDSVVLQLIECPNEEMVGGQLIKGTLQHLELYGNAYWYMSEDRRDRADRPRFPRRIDLWSPEKVTPLMPKGRLTGWKYRDQYSAATVPVDRVVHFKYANPYDPILGLGPLQAAMIIAKGDYKGHVWNDSFFNNSAMPSGILSPDGNQIMHEDSLLRLRDQIEARHGGPRKHGRIAAIKAALKFTRLDTTQKDMDFVNLMDRATEKILMVFKVPPAFAGILRDANYNALIQQAKQFWQNHLPKTQYISLMVYERMCKPFGIDERLWFKTESIKALTEDQLSLSNQARNYFNMGVPFNQINERLELGFDADSNESMRVPWIPFSLVNADEQMMAGSSSQPMGGPELDPDDPPEDQNQPGDPPTQDEPDDAEPQDPPQRQLKSELIRTINWKLLIRRVRDHEMSMERRVRDHLYKLRGEVLGNLKEQRRSVKQDDGTVTSINVDAVLFDKEAAGEDIKQRMSPLYKLAVNEGVRSVTEELQLDIDFDLLTPEVERFLAEKDFAIKGIVDEPTYNRLRAALQEGIRNGENVDKLTDRVEEVFKIERSRAARIARTETAESFNGGRYEGMQAADVQYIEWLSARDGRVRDEHRRMDGQRVRLGDMFPNGLRYPLDPSGPANELVNCRCVSLPAA